LPIWNLTAVFLLKSKIGLPLWLGWKVINRMMLKIDKMKVLKLVSLSFGIVFFSCKIDIKQAAVEQFNGKLKPVSIEKGILEDSIKIDFETGTQHCFIEHISLRNGKSYLYVESVEFLNDDEAINASKEDNAVELEMEISEKNDTLFFLYNDYYLRSENAESKIFKMSDNAKIEIVNLERELHKESILLKKLRQLLFKDGFALFEITVNQGIVESIREQYLP
jgi:hypothetical protein